MRNKILCSVLVAMLSLVFSNEADAQRCGPRGGFYRGGGYYGGPRVVVAVRPPVRYCPPPRYYGQRAYPRYRGGAVCGRGHRGCNDRVCYNDGYRSRRYDRYDRHDRDDRYDRY